MTLVEEIARCEQMAAACDDERAEEFQQLHAWLWELALRRKEVRRLKAQTSLLSSECRQLRELVDEHDLMRELGMEVES